MGYTHYQYQLRDFTDDEWEEICAETSRILTAAKDDGVEIGDWKGDPCGDWTGPEVGPIRIAFNGVGDDSHETYSLDRKKREREAWEEADRFERNGAFNCCKTALKPYDAVVVSVMAMVDQVAPGALRISSDGGDSVFTDDAVYL